jgi:hypothetical protein
MQSEDELAATTLENGVVVAGGRGTGRLTKTQEGVGGGEGDAAVAAASEESVGDKRMRQTGQVGCSTAKNSRKKCGRCGRKWAIHEEPRTPHTPLSRSDICSQNRQEEVLTTRKKLNNSFCYSCLTRRKKKECPLAARKEEEIHTTILHGKKRQTRSV